MWLASGEIYWPDTVRQEAAAPTAVPAALGRSSFRGAFSAVPPGALHASLVGACTRAIGCATRP